MIVNKKLVVLFLAIASISYSYCQQVGQQADPAIETARLIEVLRAGFPRFARLKCEVNALEVHQTNREELTRIRQELDNIAADMGPLAPTLFSARENMLRVDLEKDPAFKVLPLIDKVKFVYPKDNVFSDILTKPITQEEILFIELLRCPVANELMEFYFQQCKNFNPVLLRIFLAELEIILGGNADIETKASFMPIFCNLLTKYIDFLSIRLDKFALIDCAFPQNSFSIPVLDELNALVENGLIQEDEMRVAVDQLNEHFQRLNRIYGPDGYFSAYLMEKYPEIYSDRTLAVVQFMTQVTLDRNNPEDLEKLIEKAIQHNCPAIIEQILAEKLLQDGTNLDIINSKHLALARASGNKEVTEVIEKYLNTRNILLTLPFVEHLQATPLSKLPSELTRFIMQDVALLK